MNFWVYYDFSNQPPLNQSFDIQLNKRFIPKLKTQTITKNIPTINQYDILNHIINKSKNPLFIKFKSNLHQMLTLYIKHFKVPINHVEKDLWTLYDKEQSFFDQYQNDKLGVSFLELCETLFKGLGGNYLQSSIKINDKLKDQKSMIQKRQENFAKDCKTYCIKHLK